MFIKTPYRHFKLNQQVTIVTREHAPVMIVEDEAGNRWPCLDGCLSEQLTEINEPIKEKDEWELF